MNSNPILIQGGIQNKSDMLHKMRQVDIIFALTKSNSYEPTAKIHLAD